MLINFTTSESRRPRAEREGTSGNLYTAAKIVVHSSKTNVAGEPRHSD